MSDFLDLQERVGVEIAPDVLATLLNKVKQTLHRARSCLAFSFVRSYWMEVSNTHMQLFVHRRGVLEEATESLSLFLTKFKEPLSVQAMSRSVETVQMWIKNVVDDV